MLALAVGGVFGIYTIGEQVDSGNKLALVGGYLSLLGGFSGAFGAYFIAIGQIKHQTSMKVMDIKLDRLEGIYSNFDSIENYIYSYADLIKVFFDENSTTPFFSSTSNARQEYYKLVVNEMSGVSQKEFYLEYAEIPKEKVNEFYDSFTKMIDEHNKGNFLEDNYKEDIGLLEGYLKNIKDWKDKIEKQIIENIK